MEKKKIMIGLSGGVDSAVAAHLLLEQGHEVVAGFMKNYADPSDPDCQTRADRNMALKVAHFLGIKTFVIFDFRDEYNEKIIKYIYEGYKAGATPNPDVLCNSEIKFQLFLQKALDLGCDCIATGHYARIDQTDDGSFHLLKGKDANKDQSYFLAGLNQRQLSKSHFPIGAMTKKEVRQLAHAINLPNADRKDSQGLCFIGNVDMKTFLKEAIPTTPGEIVDTDGQVLGEHDGVQFYTIGQRQGLGLSGGPWYVVERDIENNKLVVGHKEAPELFHDQLTAKQWHRVTKQSYELPLDIQAKIRYRQADQDATLTKGEDDKTMVINFAESQRAIAEGQVVVAYQGNELIGSGIISSTQ